MKLKSEGAGCFENKSLSGICRRKGPRWMPSEIFQVFEKKSFFKEFEPKGPKMVFFSSFTKK